MKTILRLSRQYGIRMCGLAAAGIVTASALFAQSPLPRIHNAITTSEMTVLRGSQHPLATPQSDAGRLSGSTRLQGITLYFSRSAAQQADLDALLKAQQDPSSPQFHKWLTPDQFAVRFGMSESDIAQVKTWLEQQGFSVDQVMRSRNAIRFTGNVAQVEAAFRTQMHYYMVRGEKHFAPASALSIPGSLSGIVSGVRNLDDFRPRPQHVTARRDFTSGSSGNVFFAPGDIATTYDIQPLYTAGVDGAGQTIAIMGQSFVDIADVEAFQSAAGLTTNDPTMVLVAGSGNDGKVFQGDESESDLDLEWSGAIAPGAKIVFVYTGSNSSFGVYDSVQYAVDNKIGNILSLSYSSCETEVNASNLTTLEAIFSQAAAQGQTVMAASGDQGSTACYGDTNLTTAQQQALAVNYPASSAFVTGVGGTEIDMNANGGSNSTYWTQSSGSDVINSANKYIPEIVWNDDPTSGCSSGTNCLGATGGGTSKLVNRPAWQKGVPGIPSGTMRLVPDVAFYSSAGSPGYLYCTSDQSAWQTGQGQVGSCTSGFRDTGGLLTVAGGTSFATPIFAGMVALLNENAAYYTGSGLLNPALYTLAANSSTYSTVFHDVTTGNNDCLTPANCATTDSKSGFSANAGYDQVTGLGSFDVSAMALALPVNGGSSGTLFSTDVSVVPANPTPNSGDSDVFTITVAPVFSNDPAIPTGTVNLLIDGGDNFGGTTIANQTLDVNGTFAYTATFSVAGTHQVIAQYLGDAIHAASTGIGSVTIASKGKIAMKATDLTVSRGSQGSSTITVTPSGGYLGTVNLNIDFGSSDTTLANLCYSFTTMDNNGVGSVQVPGTSAVTTQLTLDTNAANCPSASGAVVKPGTHPMKRLMAGKTHAQNNQKGDNRLPGGIAFAGLLLAGLLGRHSRKLRSFACIVALASVAFALGACGGGSGGGGGGSSNPPKGTYTGTLTGTDSSNANITTTATFTFTIK